MRKNPVRDALEVSSKVYLRYAEIRTLAAVADSVVPLAARGGRRRMMGLESLMRHTDRKTGATSTPPRRPDARTAAAGFIEPMLLLRAELLPSGEQWSYELKLDGYRAIAFKRNGAVHLRSRNDNDFNGRYPGVVQALQHMVSPGQPAVQHRP